MKIAIVGSSGYIGSYLKMELEKNGIDCLGITSDSTNGLRLNLERSWEFSYYVLDECDYVIFLAAISSPDLCRTNYKEAYKINVTGTNYFIREALSRNCKVIFFSSDAVFGFYQGYADETTPTRGDTPYGLMKKEVEDNFKDNFLFKAVRLSYVFSDKDKYTAYLLNCYRNEIPAEIYHPFYRNMITIYEVYEAITWLLHEWKQFFSPYLNLCGQELISRIQIVDELNRILEKKIKYIVTKPDAGFYQNRPAILKMKSLYINNILSDANQPFSDKVKYCLRRN